MENIDFTQALPEGTSSMLSAGGIFMLSALIVLVVVIIKRWKARIMPGILGVIAYAVFVFIFANLATSALALLPGVDNVFYNNPATYNIVYAMFAAVGFTFARIICGYMLNERFERKGDVYLAGIGISAGDCLLYGMTAISYVTWCTAIQSGQAQDMLVQLASEEVATTYETVSMLFTAPVILWLLLGINCVLDMVLNIALMNVVFGAVKGDLSKWWYGISGAITFISMLSFQLYNHESIVSIALCFAVKLVIFAAAMYYTFKVEGKKVCYEED